MKDELVGSQAFKMPLPRPLGKIDRFRQRRQNGVHRRTASDDRLVSAFKCLQCKQQLAVEFAVRCLNRKQKRAREITASHIDLGFHDMRRADSGLGEGVAGIDAQARVFRHEAVVDSIVIGRHQNQIIAAEGLFGEWH